MRSALPLLLVASLIAVSAAPLGPAPWPVPAHDSANTNRNPAAILQAQYCTYSLGVPERDLPMTVAVPAPDAASVVQLISTGNNLQVLDYVFANISKSREATNASYAMHGSLIYRNEWIGFSADGTQISYFVACSGANGMSIIALPPSYKSPLWTVQVSECSGQYYYHTFADAIDVFIGGDVMRLDAKTGKQLWKVTTSGGTNTWLAGVSTGDLIVYSNTGNALAIQALNGATGAQRWQTNVPAPASVVNVQAIATPDVVMVNFGEKRGTLTGLSVATGKQLWTSPFVCAASYALTTLATLNGASVFAAACEDPSDPQVSPIVVVDPGSGKTIGQSLQLPFSPVSVLGTGDSRLVIAGFKNQTEGQTVMLTAFDIATGAITPLFQQQAPFNVNEVLLDNSGRLLMDAGEDQGVVWLDACSQKAASRA